MTKEFFIGSNSTKENTKYFDENLNKLISSCIDRGLGTRVISYLLVRHAAQVGFASTSCQMAVIFTILNGMMVEMERLIPDDYINGKFINPPSKEDDEFDEFISPENMH